MRLRLARLAENRKPKGFSLLEVIVALAIMGVALVSLIQIFSASLRATKKSSDYTVGLIYARSLMDEAYSLPVIEEGEETFEFKGGYTATRTIKEAAPRMKVKAVLDEGATGGGFMPDKSGEAEAPRLYEITVTVNWPPSGGTVLSGIRVADGE